MLDPSTGDLIAGTTTADAFRAAQQQPLQHPPGAKWAYNQTGYHVAQRIVERVTCQTWEAYAHEQVFRPAGMADTFFLGEAAPDSARVATPYRVSDGTPTPFDLNDAYEYYIPTAAGLYSTAGDLARLAQALRDGTLLAPATKRAMWTPVEASYADAPIDGYGIGWTIDRYEGQRRAWHSGGGKAAYLHHRDAGLTVIACTNRASHDVNALTTAIARVYLGGAE
jgi:CubicO group peptidase (beta-lactamase class C family)